ncbi:undecaprenyl-diphosphatase [Fictibacillus gelatini]|uniref:undecaprenyl-diphosphatase n=1 Tax=Fictibacillus gelatini TaxID=225985 RepID=UPI0003F942E0|nr:undecaprenyl-diphosphatase [Fictibacillus gelatini]
MSFSQLNVDLFRSINDLGGQYPAFNPVAVFLAENMLYVLILGMIVYWFTRREKNRLMVFNAAAAAVIAEASGKMAGLIYSHNQPFASLPHVNKLIEHAVDNSFPSDHSILFFSICASFWLMRRKEGWVWLILAICVAISRVWVGVHYPVDVLAGAFIGITSALFVYWIVPKLSFIQRLLLIYEKAEQRVLPSKNKSRNL